jgi:predicted RNase H-like nuclease (RuvC/YqgF family)
MTWILVIALFFMGVPIAEAIATRIKKSGPLDQKSLETALRQAEQRLAANETRISALEERVDFYERLLEAPKKRDGEVG